MNLSRKKRIKFAKIFNDYPYSNKDVKRMDRLIEEGMDLEKEYNAVMNKSSHYTRAMRDLIVFCWVNRKKLAKEKKLGEGKAKRRFAQNLFRRKKDG